MKDIKNDLIKLFEIKDSDLRLMTLQQCQDAVDKGIHIGGAFSALIPLITLYYGGFMNIDVEAPTKRGQDMFVLSKGHSIAALASIYADLGYFDRSVLKNSRSIESILNGHPGPILPGIHISTGPLGQGLSVASGFALAGRESPHYNVYCMVGDGELQEGPIWEAVMYAGHMKLGNLCMLVDKNGGQLDNSKQLIMPNGDLGAKLRPFGWNTVEVDGTGYQGVYDALLCFAANAGSGKPTAIICDSVKGFGGFSDFMNKHKVNIPDDLMGQEMALQTERRNRRVAEALGLLNSLDAAAAKAIAERAAAMNLEVVSESGKYIDIKPVVVKVKTVRAPELDKKIRYDSSALPAIDRTKTYAASDIIRDGMKVFARDTRVVTVDADLSSTSGLQPGVMQVDAGRALNVGIAETNMMCIGEAFASMGCNAWVSTFCPFFDWKALRRIAISYQERLEAIEAEDGWLSEGHGLDLTFLATASNFDTQTNGATHMGNDDVTIFGGLAHLKIIDVSCPQQLLSIMKWIMEGNRGLVYLRIMRAGSKVIYGPEYVFEYGRGHVVKESADDRAIVISSGRGVHEAVAAAAELEKAGVGVKVVDMPSMDKKLLLELYDSGKPVIVAEQNNGFIWKNLMKTLFDSGKSIDTGRLFPLNTLDGNGEARFIHSGTYGQLTGMFGLSAGQLAEFIKKKVM